MAPNDLAAVLREQILAFKPAPSQVDVGEVIEVGDGIALVSGLRGAMAGELLEFTKTGTLGMALNLNADNVGIIIMGEYAEHRRRRPGAQHGAHCFGAGGRCADRSCGERGRPAD